jgi:pimeloyl-ACP methyl ester carboxylesterase
MKKIAAVTLIVCMAVATVAAQSGKFSIWKDGAITTDDGCKIHYMESGEGKKTVLFVHGYLDNGSSFKYVAQHLTGDYRVISYDLRAHGASDTTPDGYTMERYAQDLKNLIDQLQLTNINIIGYSMGSHVIWDYIRQFGDGAFDKIVITVMSPKILNDAGTKYFYGMAGSDWKIALAALQSYNASYKSLMTAQQEQLRPFFTAFPVYREFYENCVNYDAGAMTRIAAAMYAADYWDVLPTITRPVLMITAQYDLYPKMTFNEQQKRLKVKSDVVVVTGIQAVANHSFGFNVPGRYAEELQKFIQ